MIGALLWKEWREQRWRLGLAALVMAAICGGLVRAQLIPTAESLLICFGPLALLLPVFLSMGAVAAERTDGTWTFLRSRPIAAARILRVKWLVGAAGLMLVMILAGAAAHAAAESRNAFDLPPPPPPLGALSGAMPSVLSGTSAADLWSVVAASLIAQLAWYSFLFFALVRAPDELRAAIGGVLLTIGCLAWALQYAAAKGYTAIESPALSNILWVSALLNPLSPLVFLLESAGVRALAAGSAVVLWIALPVWLAARRADSRGMR